MKELLQGEFKPMQEQINTLAPTIIENMKNIKRLDDTVEEKLADFGREVAELRGQLGQANARMSSLEMKAAFGADTIDVDDDDDLEYKDKCRAQVQNFKFSYNIQFDDEDDAQLFHQASRAGPSLLTWTDPRVGRVVNLRAGWDQPLPIRQRSFALGQCWQLIMDEMKQTGLRQLSMRLGSNPFAGVLHLSNSATEDAWDLVKISEHEGELGTFNVSPQDDMKEVGFDQAFIDALAERVASIVAKQRDLSKAIPVALEWMQITSSITGLQLNTSKCWVVIARDLMSIWPFRIDTDPSAFSLCSAPVREFSLDVARELEACCNRSGLSLLPLVAQQARSFSEMLRLRVDPDRISHCVLARSRAHKGRGHRDIEIEHIKVLAPGFSERRAADDLIQDIEGMVSDLLRVGFGARVEAPAIPSKGVCLIHETMRHLSKLGLPDVEKVRARHRAWQAFRGPAEHSPESASLCQAAGERPRGLCRALSEQIDAVARLQGASPEPAGADAGAAAAAELHSSLREVLWCLRPDDKASPWGDSCLEVAGLLLAADVPARLVGCLPLLGFEARKDASRVFTALLRAGASLEAEIARNLRSSPRLLRMLLEGCGDAEVFFHCSQMLRACAGEQGLLEALHQEAAADTLIALAQHPSFDISSEAPLLGAD
ncbi:unnamed protein product, partial [Prorocentrum cordatum]